MATATSFASPKMNWDVTVLLLVRNIVAEVVLVVVGAATEISALQSSLATLASVVGTAILLTAAFH